MADGLKFSYKGPTREVCVEIPLSLFGIKEGISIPFIKDRDSSDEESSSDKKALRNRFNKKKDDNERFKTAANIGIFMANAILTAMK